MPSASRTPGGPKRRPASSPARASLTGPARAADASRFAPVAGRIGAFALLAQLVEHLHGKEGVDGSSPSEGSAKAPHVGAFSFRTTCSASNVRWVWSRLWSFRVENALSA